MRALSVVGCSLSVALACAQEVHIPLNDGWQFQQVGKEQWYSAEVPGVVQTDLLRQGLIPDFMRDSNIDSVQWIENEDWMYKRTILVTDTLLKHGHLDLVFKGLDTFAEVYINDSLIGRADNMFRTWEWSVKSLLRLGANELKVIFRSPIKEGAKLREAYGIQLPHDNDPSGVSPYIRKAAYQFGWDFCPRLVTSGIWQGVELRGWGKARFSWIRLEEEAGTAAMNVVVEAGFALDVCKKVKLKVYVDDVLYVGRKVDLCSSNCERTPTGRIVLRDFHPKRWNPHGSGEQTVYRFRAEIWDNDVLLDTYTRQTGFRTVDLDLSVDSMGNAFTFNVNGRSVFMKGCNLIPPSLIPSSAMPKDWMQLVERMQAAGMNMVRVWSGGVYPPEEFYSACDTAGILIWHDFMFASPVPGSDYAPYSEWGRDFVDNAIYEIDDALEAANLHPSIALWCGNNELDVAWKNWGWQSRYGLHGNDSTKVEKVQQLFFERTIPDANPGLLYTPTSPLSNWGSAAGLRSGDLHYWGVWHGDSTFSSFKNNVGRFVSEYGFQSYPDSALLAQYIDPKELYLGSPAMKRLQRSYKTDRPIWEAMERELGEKPTTLGGFIVGSQRAQALAYEMAIKAHIKAQPHCMGTLLWQLNDCWPGPSWSIIDFEGKPKPAFEVVRRLYTGAP